MTDGVPMAGGCACGAVRYQCAGDVQFAAHCQCRDCQRATGTGHSSFFVVDRGTTVVEGDQKFHATIGESGNRVQRGFCATCGSPVFNTNDGYPDSLFFHAASLDDPKQFNPQRVVYRDSAQSWDHVDPALP